MSKSLLNVYKQQNPDASCQISKSTLGCVPKLNNRNSVRFEQDNENDGSIGDRICNAIDERINETIRENCRSICEPQHNSRVTERNSYISTNPRTFDGKAYGDKNSSIPTEVDSKHSVGQTNQPNHMNSNNSQTEIGLLKANTKAEMQSTNRQFAPSMLQNAEANKTAALADVGLAESNHFPSDDPDSSQTLHVVLLDVSSPNTHQKKRKMKDFSSITTAVPSLLEHHSDSQSNGNSNNGSNLSEQFIGSRKCVKAIEHINNYNNFQSGDNHKIFDGDLKPEAEYGKTYFNKPGTFMNSYIGRGGCTGPCNFWQPDLVAKHDNQTLDQFPINKKPRQAVKDHVSFCVTSPALGHFKSVLPNTNLQNEPVTKKSAVSVTDKEAILGKECMECTTIGYRPVASNNFTATQIGKSTAISGNSALRPTLVTSQVLSQENKGIFSNTSNCIMPQPANVSQGVFQSVYRQANRPDNISHCNRENSLIQFQNQILLQQLQEQHKKTAIERLMPSCYYAPNTLDSNASPVKPYNEIKNLIKARSPDISDNSIKQFWTLLPQLKASLHKVFRTASEAVSQNITGPHSEKNFMSDFENSFEDLMGILDRAEIYLQCAKEVQMQSINDTWFTPDNGRTKILSKTYSDYCDVVIKQNKVAKEIRDSMLSLDSFNKNNVELNK